MNQSQADDYLKTFLFASLVFINIFYAYYVHVLSEGVYKSRWIAHNIFIHSVKWNSEYKDLRATKSNIEEKKRFNLASWISNHN